jgi:predicted nucleic acid-binding protein
VIADAGITGEGVISVQVLGEFFNAIVLKRKLLSAAEVEKLLQAYAAVMTVLLLEYVLVERAVKIHQRYQTSYWDSLIIAAAADHGCSEILSEDLSDGQIYDGVRVVNPFKAAAP